MAGRFFREPFKVMFQRTPERLKFLRHRDLPPFQVQKCRLVQAIFSLQLQPGRDGDAALRIY